LPLELAEPCFELTHGGPLDYVEIQAWRSFKTTVLSKEAASGIKWYYERRDATTPLVEWNQS
jgi:hypothetical protein